MVRSHLSYLFYESNGQFIEWNSIQILAGSDVSTLNDQLNTYKHIDKFFVRKLFEILSFIKS